MTSSVIAAMGPDNSLMYYWQTIGTAPWHAEQVAGIQDHRMVVDDRRADRRTLRAESALQGLNPLPSSRLRCLAVASSVRRLSTVI